MPEQVAATLHSAGIEAVVRLDSDLVVFSNNTGAMPASGVKTMCCSAIEGLPSLVALPLLALAQTHTHFAT